MAANKAEKKAAWLEKLATDLIESYKLPTLYIDNLSVIDLIYDYKFHLRAKYIDIWFNYIRNNIVSKDRITVTYISGEKQPADLLTKQLPVDRFW